MIQFIGNGTQFLSSCSDSNSVKLTRTDCPVHHRKHTMESSRSPRSSKHHHSRSRSRSRDRKRKQSTHFRRQYDTSTLELFHCQSKAKISKCLKFKLHINACHSCFLLLPGDRKYRRSRSRSKEVINFCD